MDEKHTSQYAANDGTHCGYDEKGGKAVGDDEHFVVAVGKKGAHMVVVVFCLFPREVCYGQECQNKQDAQCLVHDNLHICKTLQLAVPDMIEVNIDEVIGFFFRHSNIEQTDGQPTQQGWHNRQQPKSWVLFCDLAYIIKV